jgi:hypothetical protein
MEPQAVRNLLTAVREGTVSIDDGLARLRRLPFEQMGFATIDHHRSIRCGFPEVIYCEGKTVEQVEAIFMRLAETGGAVLATRATRDMYEAVSARLPQATYEMPARCITLRPEAKPGVGQVSVVAAGTTDLPVAEEARVTAEVMGQYVTTHYDVGVAGLHRLLAQSEALQSAKVIVVVAGMEGALPSVVGGLVGVPVLAVPTSVGYGASFGGLAPLLTMLNSCTSNVCVVNIDNGFSAGYIAAMINRQSAGACPTGTPPTPEG